MGTSFAPAATVAASLVLTAVGVAPATAAPPEDKWFHDAFVEVVDDFCDDPETEANEGLTVEIRNDFYIRETVRLKGRDRLVQFGFQGHGTTVLTNLETGGWMEQSGVFNDRDVKVVDSGDGTLSIRFVSSGRTRYEWSSGESFMDAGSLIFDAVIDHGGTPNDPEDDEFVSETVRAVGHQETMDRDFCADFRELAT